MLAVLYGAAGVVVKVESGPAPIQVLATAISKGRCLRLPFTEAFLVDDYGSNSSLIIAVHRPDEPVEDARPRPAADAVEDVDSLSNKSDVYQLHGVVNFTNPLARDNVVVEQSSDGDPQLIDMGSIRQLLHYLDDVVDVRHNGDVDKYVGGWKR